MVDIQSASAEIMRGITKKKATTVSYVKIQTFTWRHDNRARR